jgi:phospholipid/cholesterol/gamma-HCH transport system substrate-binding protein
MMMRFLARMGVVVLAILALTSCDYQGLNSFELPGGAGHGSDAYEVTVELPDASGLVPNAEVKVADVTVGSVRTLTASNWHATAVVALDGDVSLPANAIARVGMKSLLGSSYLEMAPPVGGATGHLVNGDTIGLSPPGNYPQTEQVLAATSLLLNGGGLGQVNTITSELNKALSGRQASARDLLTQLDTFTGRLDRQKGDIVRALDGLNGLTGQLNKQADVLDRALVTVPSGLHVLNDNEGKLVDSLNSVDHLSDVATRVIDRSQDELVDNLRNLRPTLRHLADSGDSLAKALIVAGTGIFPVTTATNGVRGDYLNVDVTLDLTSATLDRNFLTGTPLAGLLTGKAKQQQPANPLIGWLQGTSQQPGDGARHADGLPRPNSPERPGRIGPTDGDPLGGLTNPLRGDRN